MASIFQVFGEILIDNKNADKSIDETTQKAEKSGSKVGSAFGSIAKGAAAVGTAAVTGAAALGTAAYKMASDTSSAADNVDKMSQKVGLSRTAYQEWDYVMSQNGMSVDKLQTGIKTLTSKMDAAKSGTASATEAFKTLGVSVTNSDGSLRSQEDVFEETIKSLQSMDNETERARLATELFGKAGTEMAPLLNQSAESTEELKNKAHELGMVMSDETIDSGVKFTDTMDTIKRSLSGMMNNIGGTVLPIVQSVLELIERKLPDIQELFTRLSPIIAEVFDSILPPLFDLVETLLPILFDLLESLLPVFESVITAVLPILVQLLQQLLPFFVQLIQEILPILVELINVLLPIITQILETVLPVIIELLEALLPPILQIIQEVLPILLELINLLVPPALQIIEAIMPVLISLLDTIMPLLQPILDALFTLLEPLLDLIELILPPITSLLTGLIDKVLPPLQWAFEGVANAISTVFSGAFEGIGKVINNIKGVFSGIIDFVENVFKGNWSRAWQAVVDIFSNIFEGIKNAFKVPINWIIDGLNIFIRGLNKIKIPDWVPGIGGFGLNINEISRLRIGMDYVPYDEYPALLHKGERVLTESENKEYSDSNAGNKDNDDKKPKIIFYITLGEKAIYVEHLDGDSKEDINKLADILLEVIEEKIRRKGVVYG